MNIPKLLVQNISIDVDKKILEDMVQEVQDSSMGDYSIPCFSFAKTMHKSPMVIANEIKDSYAKSDLVEKIEVLNGYVNFFLSKSVVAKYVINEIQKDDSFFMLKDFDGKKLCIDYSSVNLAKYMHIGHLSTTIIGESLSRIYEAMGYSVVRINYIGDYGTPFGKMMYAYLNWSNEKDLDDRGVDCLQELYVRFNKEVEEKPELEDYAREYFRLIEEKDPKIYPIYQKFIEVSKIETKSILDELGVKFDSWKGESSYSDQLSDTVKLIESKNILTKSNGAKIVDLAPYNLGVCLIEKTDGSSLYATRDICAALDRFDQYKFDKMIYVTAVQQKLHFEQFFKVLDLMGYDFAKNLSHIYYGMFSLPNGKIASRRGKQAVLRDLMEFAYNKAYKIVEDRDFKIENRESVAKKIAMSALKFNAVRVDRIKDVVFDVDNCFSFDGDTSAYMQYTYARISNILRKCPIKSELFDEKVLNNDDAFALIKAMNNYKNVLRSAYNNNEPSSFSKYALDLCKLINKYYTNQRVIDGDELSTNSKVMLMSAVRMTLGKVFDLICIDKVEEM